MPYYPRRRYNAKKRPYRPRRRYAKGKRNLVRKLKQSNNQINIKQRATTGIVVTTPTLDRSRPVKGMQWDLNQVPRHKDFVAMFDKYKINGVKVEFNLMGDTSDVLDTDGLSMLWRYDCDGKAIFDQATVDTMLASNNCKVVNFNQNKTRHTIFVKPKTLTPVYAGAAGSFGYNAGNPNIWLDTNSPNLIHYGIEYGFMNPASTIQDKSINIEVVITYYLSFKQVICTTAPALTDYTPIVLDSSANTIVEQSAPTTNSNQAQIEALQAQIDQLMDAHDSDNDHDPSGNVSHPSAAYY